MIVVPRPDPAEYPANFRGYIESLEAERVPALLADQPDRLGAIAAGLTDRAALARYAPGKWSIKDVFGHLSDTERVMSYRLLRIARGDGTPLPGFDENAFAAGAGANRRPLAELVEDFRAARHASLILARALPVAAWDLRGTVGGAPISTRALLFILVGHVEHHRRVLRERYGVDAEEAV